MLVLLLLYGLLGSSLVSAKTYYHNFVIKEAKYTRLCSTKNILTVNGQFPGPTLYAQKGDTIIVKVSNSANANITLHWHGVDQPRNPWSDGPEYVTQCPIQPGTDFTYKIILSEEEGTLWWHAHSDWDRATVHGAIFIYPEKGSSFPYTKPDKEIPIILGEWWKSDVGEVLAESLRTGGDPNISDAYTINGQPGDLYNCSKKDTVKVIVEHGKTYLLRLINAAINNELFFGIGGHKLRVVGTDGGYLKPFDTDYVMITPGQTMDLLLFPNQPLNSSSKTQYYIATRPYASAVNVPYDTSSATAILQYKNFKPNRLSPSQSPLLPTLPADNDTNAATDFTSNLKSLASQKHPAIVPKEIDERIIVTVSMNLLPCNDTTPCLGPQAGRLAASLNNISFQQPGIDVLEAYYNQIPNVYGEEFPKEPPFYYNFTEENLPRVLLLPKLATEVRVVEYNKSVELVFQGTSLLASENHPLHLHGFRFYVVGRGFGNFDKDKDPQSYNLVDPPLENTVGVPKNGWAAVRFRASNPGVWFMHCHLDRHSSWGMDTVFIVKNGKKPEEQMLPPPKNMPKC
ncbi:putative laccase [Dioscorea sansibarensis]